MNILRLRIIVPIFLLHLIALPFLLFQYMVRFEQPVWEAFGQSMLAELQRRIAIHQLTGESNVTEVQRAVDEFSGVYRFLSLRVYNSKGELRAHHGRILPGPKPMNHVAVVMAGTGQVLEVTRWVRNSDECRACHTSTQNNIGVIEASISVTDVAAEMGMQRKHIVWGAFGILLGVFALISTFHFVFIVRPVQKISRALAKIKEGDLNVRLPVTRGDELGLIAGTSTRWRKLWSSARRVLEDQHRQHMTRAEQLATVGEIAAGLAHEVEESAGRNFRRAGSPHFRNRKIVASP